MKKIPEWKGCIWELQPGDAVVHITGLVDGVGTITCPGCIGARAKVRVTNVSQVDYGTLSRKTNAGTIVVVEEVLSGCAKRPRVC